MALSKSKKKEVLGTMTDIANAAKSVVFVGFHGLSVSDSTAMRKELRNGGVGYTVAKKTLARKAFTEKNIKGTMPELEGEVALAYGEDLIAPAREIRNFEKKFDGKLSILGGIFDGEYKSKEEMSAIAAIPGREQLYGMFVNLINSPIQRMVIVLDQIAKSKA
jgi:large subunit ribosomal protein L10